MSRSTWLLLSVAVFAAPAALAQAGDPESLAKKATERARSTQITVQPVKPSPELLERAKQASGGARNRARDELSRLAEQHPYSPKPADATAATPENPSVKSPPDVAGRVVIALSSSVPETVWREYMAQIDGKKEAIVVLRGFVGGAKKVTPTGSLIERMRRKVPSDMKGGHRAVEVVVDPLVYRSLGIDRVPAIAWLPGVKELSHCDGQTFESAVIVYGNVSVGFALNQIKRNGGDVPAEVIKKFGG